MVGVASSPAWLLDNASIARDRTAQVKVEPEDDRSDADCKTTEDMRALCRHHCGAGWQNPRVRLLNCDQRAALHEEEQPGEEEERCDDENFPRIVP